MRTGLHIVVTAILVSQTLSCAARTASDSRLPNVTIGRLADNKFDYHGERIQIIGVVAHRFEHYRLYWTWRDFKDHVTANSIGMRFPDERRGDLSHLHGARAIVTGTFDAEYGQTGGIKVESVTRYHVSEDEPERPGPSLTD